MEPKLSNNEIITTILNLRDVCFVRSDLSGVSFERIDLRGVDLSVLVPSITSNN